VPLILTLAATEPAYAYLDPGTGSILLQGLIAAIAAGLVVIKLYWQKVKAFLFGRSEKASSPADDAPEEDDSG
ncbi:MAG: hypothetical protein OEU36_15150, partial [Gammaproteobacteria bacterium]|nr:hypothetical protein [Gammaproteobacteria bacterium]